MSPMSFLLRPCFPSLSLRATLLLPRRARSLSSMRGQAYLEPIAEGVAAISLNRPQAKNAISMQLLSELRASIDAASNDPSIRVLIIRSSERGSFCAGADLAERRTMSPASVSTFLSDLRLAFGALEDFRMPTIAAIDGPALGGGLELALACDFRIAGRDVTKIGLPETKLGIIPGAGGTQRAARLLGITKAKELIFTGRMLTASDALAYGLVEYVAESAFDRALQLANEISSGAPLALRAAKMAVSRADQVPLETGLDFERACYAPLLRSKDRDEALEAFKEKRKPIFLGQ